jgi:putative transposase
MSPHQREDGQLAEQIQAASHANRGGYGSPRVQAELQAQGIPCSRKRVARLMREQELPARRHRHRGVTTHSDPGARVAPNRWDRDCAATHPNEKGTGDLTAIWTEEGWLSLAAVLDLFSRRVGGWALAASADEPLVEMARRLALRKRRPQAGLTSSSRSRMPRHEPWVSSAACRRWHCREDEPQGELVGQCRHGVLLGNA